ncbi:MAG: carbohydrate binding family 9 domain-containing protein [Acidobacteria bacterium]|nr:carbohydrate binding family 9 domain-containing protein [Acidobacteriota bacterium]MCA1609691.1 carbohydrate binding family 9 domain-containing protein [Acidobacteriota bacterium]
MGTRTASRKLVLLILLYLLALWLATTALHAQEGEPIHITRTDGPITIDADLSDPGWKNAARIETWFETNPGDNLPPKVRNVGYLTYDDKFFYAAFEFADPDPSRIRAPYADRDNVGSALDYGGIIINPRNDGRSGILFLANPRGIQYDAVSDDFSGEDSSPDFYWDSAAKITPAGWVLEMRVPFSSLRYPKGDPQTWAIMLYRNYPRQFRYQFFTSRLPRGSSCFLCHCLPLTGLSGLPSGGHLVVAPYATFKEEGVPRGDPGSPLLNKPARGDGGVDAKWNPNENTAIDATINPDFSQVESDVAKIGVNERFALNFPEKRPFFLEGIELFSTPIPAVYTRSITSPRWGARATGKMGETGYTVLLAEDRGGGSVILPGPNGSDFADQDFRSFVGIGRARHNIGKSFVSFLATDREISGGAYNRVYGPDVQWRPNDHETVTGQFLLSNTKTPDRPDLTPQWTGRRLDSHGAEVWYQHTDPKFDWFTEYQDFGDGFRAEDGFVPQVGYRRNYLESGYTTRPKGIFNRFRRFVQAEYSADTEHNLIFRDVSGGIELDGRWNSSSRFRLAFDRVRSGTKNIPRRQLLFNIQFAPSGAISGIALSGYVGEQVDFANSRGGRGANLVLAATVRPSDHLALAANGALRWLNVTPDAGGSRERLFTAEIARLKATYTFTARSYFRAIAQYVRTNRDVSLYRSAVNAREGSLTGSALFAYKLNWQSVLFLGYGDSRTLSESNTFERQDRQFFLKVSYAFQR